MRKRHYPSAKSEKKEKSFSKKTTTFLPVLTVLLILLFSSCGNADEVSIKELSEYPQPQTIPLVLTEPQPLHWDTIGQGHLKPTVYPLDFGKLTAMPYDPDGFKPITSTSSGFNFDELPATDFIPENAKRIPLKWETKMLPKAQPSVTLSDPSRVLTSTMEIKAWTQLEKIEGRIFSVFQDASGVLWIAGSKLYKFDGSQLTPVLSENAQYFCISTDRKGNLWFLSAANKVATINKLEIARNIVHSAPLPFSFYLNSRLNTDDKGGIWISQIANSTLINIDTEEEDYAVFDKKVGLRSVLYFDANFDDKGRLWASSNNGIEIIDQKTNKIIRLGEDNGLKGDTVIAVSKGTEGKMWAVVRQSGRLFIESIQLEKGVISHYLLQQQYSGNSAELLFDEGGNLWLGNRLGMAILNTRKNLVRYISDERDLPYPWAYGFLQNGSNVLALCTSLDGYKSRLLTIEQSGKTVFPFANTQVVSTHEDSRGNLWVGTNKALYVVDSSRKQYWQMDTTNGLANHYIQSLSGQNGKISITTNGGYSIYDPLKNTITRVTRNEGLASDTVYSVLTDARGDVWIAGANKGLIKYEKESGLILQTNTDRESKKDIIFQVLKVNGKVWVMTAQIGPGIIDIDDNTIQFIENPAEINTGAYKGAYLDSKNNVWLTGTHGWGLYKVDPEMKAITRFTTCEGLGDNSTYSTVEFNGRYIINTESKINILTPPELSENKSWKIQTLLNGNIPKRAGTFMSDALTEDGSYLWGDIGLAVINPIIADTLTGKNFITGIRIMDRDLLLFDRNAFGTENTDTQKLKINAVELGYLEKGVVRWDSLSLPFGLPVNLSLPFDQNVVQLSFTELSAGRLDTLKFAYALEGVDKRWTITTDHSTRTYLNLSPGDYTFKVTSKWKNGSWNEPATFSFTIRPPWYQTWWAYLMYVVVTLSLLRGYILLRSRKLRKENRILEEKVNQRTEELQQKTDELQTKTDELQQSYNNVEQLEEIGKKITSSLSVEKIIGTVYKNVNQLMDASVFGIGIYNQELNRLDFPSTYEKGSVLPFYYNDVSDQERLSAVCFNEEKEIVLEDVGEQHKKFLQRAPMPVMGEQTASVIYLPLMVKEKKLGVITVQSFKPHAYTDYHLNMLRNIAIYAAIALDNARSYETLKATQVQLIHSEKMASLGELTAGIAHEIQNPLNFVNNFSEINKELTDELKAEIASGNWQSANEIIDDIKGNSDKINFHGKRADAIVKGMLQHSRGTSGQKEMTDINSLCDEYLRLSYHGLRAKDKSFNAKYEARLDESNPMINVVPQDIGRVILNLLNNAFYAVSERKKAGEPGYAPEVIIETRNIGHVVNISVKDNGNGMSPEVVKKVFQPFFTTKPTGKGTGLGLSLVYDIVKAHNGELKVNSESGVGSEFVIQLPLN